MIIMSPESTPRRSLSGSSFSFNIHLRFDFFLLDFTYKFYGLDAFLSQLGGATTVIAESFTENSFLLVVLWMLIFANLLSKHAKDEYKEFVQDNYRDKLEEYR